LGIARIPDNWQLRDAPGPALRRGLLVALPVGVAVLIDLQLDSPVAGGLSTGALLAGFLAFDAPARTRFTWQILAAPLIGASGALGALTSSPGWLAVLAMTVFASLAGLTVAVSLRLSIAGMVVTLALLLAQGFGLHPHDAPDALVVATLGALAQALLSLLLSLRDRKTDWPRPIAGAREAARTIAASIDRRSPSLRHALRWGIGLGIGVAAYQVIDLGPHGYWIPLTVLFVLKATPSDTSERIAMCAVGTFAGLVLATGIAELIGREPVLNAVILTVAAACSFALLAIEYALFTTAITVYIVVLSHALGQGAFQAVDERGVATLIGLGIAALGFVVLRDRGPAIPSTAPT
jgi:Fusaric acid resistance protein-like